MRVVVVVVCCVWLLIVSNPRLPFNLSLFVVGGGFAVVVRGLCLLRVCLCLLCLFVRSLPNP